MPDTPENQSSSPIKSTPPVVDVKAVLEPGQPTPLGLKRYIPIVVVFVGITIFFVGGFQNLLSFQSLAENYGAITAWTADHHALSVMAFILIYIVVVGLSLPGGVWLTLAGGLIFGGVWGALYVVVGATLGATAIFLAARYAFADLFQARAGSNLDKMKGGFQKNAFSYLLFLRLVPAFPFWLVNLVPALLDVKFRTYVVATFIGIIPGTTIYAHVGAGLGAVIEKGEAPNLGIILEPQILLPILGLAGLSLVPVLYKKFKG
ncbi:MAG: TVP38/TMEM64 family protein [Magnetovibrio sp.]|nr:TVP38/TMEM64 family protein [Magnetovibrio sp.]